MKNLFFSHPDGDFGYAFDIVGESFLIVTVNAEEIKDALLKDEPDELVLIVVRSYLNEMKRAACEFAASEAAIKFINRISGAVVTDVHANEFLGLYDIYRHPIQPAVQPAKSLVFENWIEMVSGINLQELIEKHQ